MELASARPMCLQIAGHRVGSAVPVVVPVLETPLAAEQNQGHGHTAFKDQIVGAPPL
jgi:hypothetical protein